MGMANDGSVAYPEKNLAALIAKELKVEIDPEKLAEFVKNQWVLIQSFAHRIHDNQMMEAGREDVRREMRSILGADGAARIGVQ